MIVFIIQLFLAHILGDFVFQPDHWVTDKTIKKFKSAALYKHTLVHLCALIVVLAFDFSYWKGILIIIVSHYSFDLAKLYIQEKWQHKNLLFLLDQLAHTAIILYVVQLYHPFQLELSAFYTAPVLLLIVALLSASFVSSILIKNVLSYWQIEEQNKEDSLKSAGKYIGMLERLFVFGFIVLNQWQAIGFLIAAKSIFRFSDLSRAKDRKLTEYILVGTLLSFALAIIIGLAYQYARKVLL